MSTKSWVPLFSHALMPTGTSHRSPNFPHSQLLSVLPVTVTIHPATDPFHAQGNLQTPPQPPVPARTSLPPSLLPSSSSTTRGWSSPISSVGVALPLRSVGRGVRYQSRSFWQRRKTDRRRRTLRRRGGCSGRAGKAAARSLARSFATCESAVGEQIAERKEERPRE